MGTLIFVAGLARQSCSPVLCGEVTMTESRPLRQGDPERLGGYRLIGILGEGGQGIVYLGERDSAEPDDSSEESRERFAVKLLRTHLAGNERARKYFARELSAAQRIDPSFTARIVEADVDGRTPYIVSEFVEGRALSDAVRTDGPLAGEGLHRLAVGTLNALAAIHQANVVHRDFKPSNVLLSADRPRVIDFGIARALDATMSVSSGVVGTPAYMAPEQLGGQQITPAVDIFAWGATMVFAATGVGPFGQDSIPVMMQRILHADPVIGDVQGPLRDLVWYCLYKDPAQRPTTQQALSLLGDAPGEAFSAPFGATPGSWTASWAASPVPPPPVTPAPPQTPTPALAPASAPAWESPGHSSLPPVQPWGTDPNAQPGVDTPPPAPWGTTGTRSPQSRRRRWLPAAAAAASVALVATGTILTLHFAGKGSSKDGPSGSAAGRAAPRAVDAALTGVVNPSTAKGGTLKLQQALEFDSLDPADMYFTGSWNFSRLYARSLLTYKGTPGTAGLRPVPDLATGPGEASADLKTWTYHLRTGVTYEDGTPVTAKDVRYAVARTFAADVFLQGPSYFRELLDAGTYAGPYKNTNLDTFTGVTTPDDHTVVFHLKKPYADFDYLAALPQTAPVPAAKDTKDKYKEHPVSTGPYKIESHVATKSVSLVRNTTWRPDGIRTALPDRIEITFGPDADTVDQALLNGQADMEPYGTGLQNTAISRVFADPSLQKNTDTITSGFLQYVALSTKVQPFDNVHCRLAVQYAVDRAAVQAAAGGSRVAAPATNLTPPVIVGAQKFDAFPTSTEKAKQELGLCGKPAGFTTKIAIRQDRPKDTAMAQALQQGLTKVGIKATIAAYPTTQFYTDTAGKPDYVHKNGLGMILASWGPDYPAATGFFPLLVDGRHILPSSNSDMAELNDPGVNGLLDRLNDTRDQKTRDGLTAQLDHQVMNTGALVPLVNTRFVLYRNPRLTNAVVSQMYVGYDLATLGVS
jgi:ABC-type transport system substrate-binding protein/serine/threonine protein kinase